VIRPTTETTAGAAATADRKADPASRQVRPLFSPRVNSTDGRPSEAASPAVPFHETLSAAQEQHQQDLVKAAAFRAAAGADKQFAKLGAQGPDGSTTAIRAEAEERTREARRAAAPSETALPQTSAASEPSPAFAAFASGPARATPPVAVNAALSGHLSGELAEVTLAVSPQARMLSAQRAYSHELQEKAKAADEALGELLNTRI